jgi:sec-independent protein translocase protein TatC
MNEERELSGQMSFMEHLDELRKRLVRSIIVIALGFFICWNYSQDIYNFLEVPINQELEKVNTREFPIEGITGDEKIQAFEQIVENQTGKFVFDKVTKLGVAEIPAGTTVLVKAIKDENGKLFLYTQETIFSKNSIIPQGVKLPEVDWLKPTEKSSEGKLIVTTAQEPFTLYITVSLYGAICLAVPFLLWQIWGFISPALYAHEKKYVTPFITLSSLSFVGGVAFAYYILFPPALRYMFGLGENFNIMPRATDYFDLITLIMLAMGIIFQMPAVSYVLSRIGLISAQLLINIWKYALVVILIIAAVISPTGDIPNMLLFSSPMIILYLFSILIAYIFGKERKTEA